MNNLSEVIHDLVERAERDFEKIGPVYALTGLLSNLRAMLPAEPEPRVLDEFEEPSIAGYATEVRPWTARGDAEARDVNG